MSSSTVCIKCSCTGSSTSCIKGSSKWQQRLEHRLLRDRSR